MKLKKNPATHPGFLISINTASRVPFLSLIIRLSPGIIIRRRHVIFLLTFLNILWVLEPQSFHTLIISLLIFLSFIFIAFLRAWPVFLYICYGLLLLFHLSPNDKSLKINKHGQEIFTQQKMRGNLNQ